jgi:hypothetical protein
VQDEVQDRQIMVCEIPEYVDIGIPVIVIGAYRIHGPESAKHPGGD